MSTRINSKTKSNFGQSPLPTGYENSNGVPDLFIPSCGIEDVDVALFNLFDKEIKAEFGGKDGSELKKVPVIFAAGEKWAMLKNGRALRDKNNTLIIPLITIMRTELNQDFSEDVAGRGINQQSGELTVKRRLDKSDRSYQALINRMLIPNQDNVSGGGRVSTEGTTGDLSDSENVRVGALLAPNLLNNIYETIVVPAPQFYTAKYQVTVWTQYTQHSNQILEKFFSTFLPQGQSWRLETAKGYWFIAKFEQGSFSSETNFEDMSQQERYIKHTFNVNVPAYFFASSSPGMPVPIKRYVSTTSVSFDVSENGNQGLQGEEDSQYFLGSDDPTLPLDDVKNIRDDQRSPGWRIQKTYPVSQNVDDPVTLSNDPALSSFPSKKYIKVRSRTAKGETSYSGVTLDGLEIVIIK